MRTATILFLSILSARAVAAEDKSKPGEFITEPATLISLGFEWRIEGDDNRNARVDGVLPQEGRAGVEGGAAAAAHRQRAHQRERAAVRRRRTGSPEASSISSRPRTTSADSCCRIRTASMASRNRSCTVRTRAEPKPAAGRQGLSRLSSRTITGERQEPAFTGLLAAYYTGSSHSDNFNTYPPRVQPGDTILVHAGLYKDDRYRYGGGLGTVSSGTYFLTQSGTAEQPIVIKAAGDGEVDLRRRRRLQPVQRDGRELQLLRRPDDSKHRSRLSGRAEEHHRLERADDQALPIRERRAARSTPTGRDRRTTTSPTT